MLNKKELIDLIFNEDNAYLTDFQNHKVFNSILSDVLYLEEDLRQNNLELHILSAYRSFNSQQSIWNQKVLGQRDVLDERSKKIDIRNLTNEELFFKILNWSAFPTLSRHHFGTELDIADGIYLQENPRYQCQMIDSEYLTGPFKNLFQYTKSNLKNFYHPYQKDLGGIKPEPWHISNNISKEIISDFTYEIFLDFLNSDLLKDILLLDIAKKNSKLLYHQYFLPRLNV